MNIHTVAENLRNTIEGKEGYRQVLARSLDEDLEFNERIVIQTTINFLEVNLDELRKILADVEVCCQQYSDLGWQINPERMGQ